MTDAAALREIAQRLRYPMRCPDGSVLAEPEEQRLADAERLEEIAAALEADERPGR